MKDEVKDSIQNKQINIEVPLTIKNLHEDDEDDKFFRFEAFGSTFGNVDLVDDVMVKGCFAESLAKETPVILWQHDRDEPIGMPETIAETNKGLKLNVIMPKDDDFVRGRVMPQLRVGSVKAMSIGFIIEDFDMEDGIRFIKKCTLKEVSLVTFPANPEAVVTDVKRVGEFQSDLLFAKRSEPEMKIKSVGSSNKDDYLWSDGKDNHAFQFVSVIDGKRKIVPLALFSAKAALQADNSSASIPEEDRSKVLSLVNKYINKLDEFEPVKMLEPRDLKDMTKRELESSLRESGRFSKNASIMIASNFSGLGDPPECDDDAITKAVEDILRKEEEATILNKLEKLSH